MMRRGVNIIAAPNQRIFIICRFMFRNGKHFPFVCLYRSDPILMDNQALRQLNQGFVRALAHGLKHLPRLFSLCVLITEPGCRSWCRVAYRM